MQNEICKLLNIKYPVFQGAMAWIADASLASAVSNAGGLGIIAAGNAPCDIVREQIRKAKTLTDKPFGLNIMLLSPYVDDILQLVLDEDVKVITTGAGSPGKFMPLFKQRGIKVIPVVPSVAIAKKMQDAGADAIIAEGMESGGHIGKLTTMALVPQVVDNVDIPVIAAGGIADTRAVKAAFALGACGVQVGTRFLVANECNVHKNYKEKVLKAKDIDTVITGSITGHPVRVLKNKLVREFEKVEKQELKKDKPDLERFDELGRGALQRAVIDGDVDFGSVMAGQIAGLVNKEESCQDIINELVSSIKDLL